ncbi:hypothetical protein MMC31_008255, partial [Peltigera leucophlebia]|nr:hypothetical protein [Peltigera leucophlebia]
MEDSTQKRAGEPLEVSQRRRGRPSRRKLEPIPPRPLLSGPVDPTPSSSTVNPFSVGSSHPTPLLSTVDLSSVTSSRRRFDPSSLRQLVPTVDPILSLGDIPVVTTASNATDNLLSSGIYSRRRRPRMQMTPTSGTTPTLVPGSQSHYLSLGDIPVITTASNATDNLLSSSIHSRRRRPRMQMTSTSETTPTLVPGSQSQSPVEPVSLVDDFQQRKEAWLRFPPPLNNETTRAAIHRYQVQTDDATMHLNHVCGSCSRFTHPSELKIIPKDNPVVTTASATGFFSLDQFDSCGCSSQSYTFCKECWKRITEGKSPKYSISNGMPQLCCQNYPSALENLSIAEEAVIARAHPV